MTTDSLRYSLAALVIAVTGSIATPAAAQQARCAPREEVLQHLAKTYLEQPAAVAVTQQGALMEVLTSASGTWTALISMPDGTSCLLAAGEGWRSLPQEDFDGRLTALPEVRRPGT
jgi:hypothetical protein